MMRVLIAHLATPSPRNRLPRKWQDPQASWRRMLVTQPPVRISVTISDSTGRTFDEEMMEPATTRFGLIAEWVENRCNEWKHHDGRPHRGLVAEIVALGLKGTCRTRRVRVIRGGRSTR